MKKSWITYLLIVINIAVFIWQFLYYGSTTDTRAVVLAGGMYPPIAKPWNFLTMFFVHIGIQHLFTNMISLFVYGSLVEHLLGHTKFLLVYLVTGLGGSVAVYFFSPFTVTAGASSAIFGLLGSLIILVFYFNQLAQRLMIWVVSIAGYNLYSTFTDPNVSVAGHLGGFVTGLMITMILIILQRSNPNTTRFHHIDRQKNRKYDWR